MLICQNDNNRFQFTVVLDTELIDTETKILGTEQTVFDSLPGSYKDREKLLADVITTGLIEANKEDRENLYIFWDEKRLKFCIVDPKTSSVNWVSFEKMEDMEYKAGRKTDLYVVEENPNQLFVL